MGSFAGDIRDISRSLAYDLGGTQPVADLGSEVVNGLFYGKNLQAR